MVGCICPWAVVGQWLDKNAVVQGGRKHRVQQGSKEGVVTLTPRGERRAEALRPSCAGGIGLCLLGWGERQRCWKAGHVGLGGHTGSCGEGHGGKWRASEEPREGSVLLTERLSEPH